MGIETKLIKGKRYYYYRYYYLEAGKKRYREMYLGASRPRESDIERVRARLAQRGPGGRAKTTRPKRSLAAKPRIRGEVPVAKDRPDESMEEDGQLPSYLL